MAKTPEYTRKAIDEYRKNNDFINLRFPKGTKERIKNLGISNSDLVDECLNFISGIEEVINNDSLPVQTVQSAEIKPRPEEVKKSIKEPEKPGNEPSATVQKDFSKEEQEPSEENGFDGLEAKDWTPEKHKGIVPYPPRGISENATWDSKSKEWYEPLPFSW